MTPDISYWAAHAIKLLSHGLTTFSSFLDLSDAMPSYALLCTSNSLYVLGVNTGSLVLAANLQYRSYTAFPLQHHENGQGHSVAHHQNCVQCHCRNVCAMHCSMGPTSSPRACSQTLPQMRCLWSDVYAYSHITLIQEDSLLLSWRRWPSTLILSGTWTLDHLLPEPLDPYACTIRASV